MRGSLLFKRLLRDNRGATAVEYGLIVALIVIAIIGALQGVGGANGLGWGNINTRVTEALRGEEV